MKHCLRRRKSYNVNAPSDGNDAYTKLFRFCGGRDPTVRNARQIICDKRGHGVGFFLRDRIMLDRISNARPLLYNVFTRPSTRSPNDYSAS